MAQQTIGIGSTANDGTGDTLRDAFGKANDNFTELYQPTSNATAPATSAVVKQAADVATIISSIEPFQFGQTEGSSPVIGRWNWAINDPVDFAGTADRKNRVLGFGYNISKYAGGTPTAQENSGDASFGWTFEDFYNVSGGLRLFEWYLQTVPAGAEPGANQLRPFMVIVQYPTEASDTTPLSGIQMRVEEQLGLNIIVKHATGEHTWGWKGIDSSTGLDTVCEVTAGSGFLFANNSRSIKAKNSSGSPVDLIWLDSSNRVILGQGGTVRAGGLMDCSANIQTPNILVTNSIQFDAAGSRIDNSGATIRFVNDAQTAYVNMQAMSGTFFGEISTVGKVAANGGLDISGVATSFGANDSAGTGFRVVRVPNA